MSEMYIYLWTDEIGDSISEKQTKRLPRFKKPQLVYAFDPKIKVPRDLETPSNSKGPRAPEWQPKPIPEHNDEFKRLTAVGAMVDAYNNYCDLQDIGDHSPRRNWSRDHKTFLHGLGKAEGNKTKNKNKKPPKALASPRASSTQFSVGTDCSGMDTPIQALRNLELDFKHKFSSETDPDAIKTIMANHKPERMEGDISNRDLNTTPYVDVYIAGFPCQPFSAAGKQQGFQDEKGRGTVFLHILQYIQSKQPKVFILENVKGLATMDKGKHMKAILKGLNDIQDKKTGKQAYYVTYDIMNTKEHGIPQNRPRWYCVGILKNICQSKKNNPEETPLGEQEDDSPLQTSSKETCEEGPQSFRFPEPIGSPSIETLLDCDTNTVPYNDPSRTHNATVTKNVAKAIDAILADGNDPYRSPYIVDCDASPSRTKHMWDVSPCITRSRQNGHWITNQQRRMNKAEMLRLQGMDPSKFVIDVSSSKLGQQIGNAMSVNVIERILIAALKAANIVRGEKTQFKRWENGTAIAEILQSIEAKPITKSETEEYGLGAEKWNLSKSSARIYIVDSGASFHIVDFSELSKDEQLTVKELPEPITLKTANGYNEATHYAIVYVKELGMSVKAILLEDSPAILSLGRLCRKDGFEFRWPQGEPGPSNEPHLIKDGHTYNLFSDNDVPHVTAAKEVKQPVESVKHNASPESDEVKKMKAERDEMKKAIDEFKITMDKNKEALEKAKEECLKHKKAESNRIAYKSKKLKKNSCKTSEHNIFTHFPKDPACRICQLSKVQKAHCKIKTEHKGDDLPIPQKFGDAITCDHKILNEDQEDAEEQHNIFVILDRYSQFLQAYAAKQKSTEETKKAFQRYFEPNQEPEHVYSDNSKEIKKACDELGYTHDTSTPHRSETNGVAERAVRRVREGTAAVLTQSGFTEHWWSLAMQAFCFLRCVVDKLDNGQTAYFNRFGVDYSGPAIPFGALVEYFPKNAKDETKVHPMGNQRLPAIFVEYKQQAGCGWKNHELGIIDCQDLNDAPYITSLRDSIKVFHADEIIVPYHNGDFYFPLVEGDYNQPHLPKAEAKSTNYTKKIKEKQDLKIKQDKEAEEKELLEAKAPESDVPSITKDFWTCTNEVITIHHRTPRTKLFVPTEENLPIKLKYIDILRRTVTSIKDFKFKEIKDFWVAPGSDTELEEPWTGYTTFELLRPKAKQFHHWVYGRETKTQTTTRPGDVHPEEWPHMSSKNKDAAKKSWEVEGPKREKARAERGIYMVDASDEKHYAKQIAKAIATNSVPKAPAMACMPVALIASRVDCADKYGKMGAKFAQKYFDKVNARDQRPHQDRVASAGHASEEYLAMVHKAVDLKVAKTIPKAVEALDKEWDKLTSIPTWDTSKVRERHEVREQAQKSKVVTHFGQIMQLCHIKNSELSAEMQSYKGRIVFRGDQVRDENGFYAVFSEQGTSASHMAGTKIINAIARMPGNCGEDSDAIAAYTQIPLSDAVRLLGMDVMPETWISLPFDRWPKDGSWKKFKDPVCPLTQNLYGHPLAGLLWDKGSQERIINAGFEKIKGWESLYVHQEKRMFLSVYVDDFHMAGPKENMKPMWQALSENGLKLDPPVPFNGHQYLGCQQVEVENPIELIKNKIALIESIQQIRTPKTEAPDAGGCSETSGASNCADEIPTTPRSKPKAKTPPATPEKSKKKAKKTEAKALAAALKDSSHKNSYGHITSYEDRMNGAAEGCIERYLELSKCKIESLKRVGTPCIDDNLMSPEDFISKGALAPFASKIVLKALYLARLARPDLLYSVNALAREVTKWTAACDKRLHRLMSYIHHTRDNVMLSFVGDRACDCKLMLFCDASFAGDLTDSKSTSGSILCLVGPNTFAPLTWMCKKQGAVSHSSTEAEVISMDAAVRLDGLPLLMLWDLVIATMHPETCSKQKLEAAKRPQMSTDYHILNSVDYVPPSMPITYGKAKLLILEDNDAVIKMCIKCRSPNMRHVGRTHRVDLDWLFERIHKDPAISIKYVNTKQQLADILTKGSFTESTWKTLCELIQIQPKCIKTTMQNPGGENNSITSSARQAKQLSGPQARVASLAYPRRMTNSGADRSRPKWSETASSAEDERDSAASAAAPPNTAAANYSISDQILTMPPLPAPEANLAPLYDSPPLNITTRPSDPRTLQENPHSSTFTIHASGESDTTHVMEKVYTGEAELRQKTLEYKERVKDHPIPMTLSNVNNLSTSVNKLWMRTSTLDSNNNDTDSGPNADFCPCADFTKIPIAAPQMSLRANVAETSALESLHRWRNWLKNTGHSPESYGELKTYEYSTACWRSNAEDGIRALEYLSMRNLKQVRKSFTGYEQRTMGDLFTHLTHCMNFLIEEKEIIDLVWSENLGPWMLKNMEQPQEWERTVTNIVQRPCSTMFWRAIGSVSVVSGDSTLKLFTASDKKGNTLAYKRWKNDRAMTKHGESRSPGSPNQWLSKDCLHIGAPQMRHAFTMMTVSDCKGMNEIWKDQKDELHSRSKILEADFAKSNSKTAEIPFLGTDGSAMMANFQTRAINEIHWNNNDIYLTKDVKGLIEIHAKYAIYANIFPQLYQAGPADGAHFSIDIEGTQGYNETAAKINAPFLATGHPVFRSNKLNSQLTRQNDKGHKWHAKDSITNMKLEEECQIHIHNFLTLRNDLQAYWWREVHPNHLLDGPLDCAAGPSGLETAYRRNNIWDLWSPPTNDLPTLLNNAQLELVRAAEDELHIQDCINPHLITYPEEGLLTHKGPAADPWIGAAMQAKAKQDDTDRRSDVLKHQRWSYGEFSMVICPEDVNAPARPMSQRAATPKLPPFKGKGAAKGQEKDVGKPPKTPEAPPPVMPKAAQGKGSSGSSSSNAPAAMETDRPEGLMKVKPEPTEDVNMETELDVHKFVKDELAYWAVIASKTSHEDKTTYKENIIMKVLTETKEFKACPLNAKNHDTYFHSDPLEASTTCLTPAYNMLALQTAGLKDKAIRPLKRNQIVGPIEEVKLVKLNRSQHCLGCSDPFNYKFQDTKWETPYTDEDDENNRLILVAVVPNPEGKERGDSVHITIWDKHPKGFFTTAQAPIQRGDRSAKTKLKWRNLTKEPCKPEDREMIKTAAKQITGLCRHANAWEKCDRRSMRHRQVWREKLDPSPTSSNNKRKLTSEEEQELWNAKRFRHDFSLDLMDRTFGDTPLEIITKQVEYHVNKNNISDYKDPLCHADHSQVIPWKRYRICKHHVTKLAYPRQRHNCSFGESCRHRHLTVEEAKADMKTFDDGTLIQWGQPDPDESRKWYNIINARSIDGLISILQRSDRPNRMQVADGPLCKAQYMRTSSGHAWKMYEKMDKDQMYVVVQPDDWPRLPNRRRFFHVGTTATVEGAEYGGLQPGHLQAVKGQNYKSEVNYTCAPDLASVKEAAQWKLDGSGRKPRNLFFEDGKDFNPDNIYAYGGDTIIIIDVPMAEALGRDGKFDAHACGSESDGFPRACLLYAICTWTGDTIRIYNTEEEMFANYTKACKLGIMKDPKVLQWHQTGAWPGTTNSPFESLLQITGADKLIEAKIHAPIEEPPAAEAASSTLTATEEAASAKAAPKATPPDNDGMPPPAVPKPKGSVAILMAPAEHRFTRKTDIYLANPNGIKNHKDVIKDTGENSTSVPPSTTWPTTWNGAGEYCSCGQKLHPNNRWCRECGNPLEKNLIKSVKRALASILPTNKLIVVHNNSKDEAKNLWNHRRTELHRELQKRKNDARQYHEQGIIDQPTIRALFSTNPEFKFTNDKKIDVTVPYMDTVQFPTSCVEKDNSHLNPFWKQFQDYETLDTLLDATCEIQDWTNPFRQPVPMFKIVKRVGTNKFYQTKDGIATLQLESEWGSENNTPTDAGDTTSEYDYLHLQAVKMIQQMKRSDEFTTPIELEEVEQNVAPTEEWMQLIRNMHAPDSGRKRDTSTEQAPQPKRPRGQSAPPAKAGNPAAATRSRSEVRGNQNQQGRGRERSRSKGDPTAYQKGSARGKNKDWDHWEPHDPHWVHWTSQGTGSPAYQKGKKGKGSSKTRDGKDKTSTGKGSGKYHYPPDQGDYATTWQEAKGKTKGKKESKGKGEKHPPIRQEDDSSMPMPPLPPPAELSSDPGSGRSQASGSRPGTIPAWDHNAETKPVPDEEPEIFDRVSSHAESEHEDSEWNDEEWAAPSNKIAPPKPYWLRGKPPQDPPRPKWNPHLAPLRPVPQRQSTARSSAAPYNPIGAAPPRPPRSSNSAPPEEFERIDSADEYEQVYESRPSNRAATMIDQMKELAKLRRDGDITEPMFQVMRAALMGNT